MAIPLLLGSFYLARGMEMSSEGASPPLTRGGVDFVAEGRGAEFGVQRSLTG